jgi:hypothetical protein
MTQPRDRTNPGLYLPAAGRAISFLERLSLGRWIDRIASVAWPAAGGRASPLVTELYQLLWLAIAGASFLAAWQIAGAGASVRGIVAIILYYHVLEILLFLLAWLFVERSRLDSYRRSLLGFFGNVVEITLLFSALDILTGCDAYGRKQVLWRNLTAVTTLESVDRLRASGWCFVLVTTRLVVSVCLVVVIIAAVVGTVLRKERDADFRGE